MFPQNVCIEIVAEGFRNKIFNNELLAALVDALGDKNSRISAVEIFTAAIAQGVPHCFHDFQKQNGRRWLSG